MTYEPIDTRIPKIGEPKVDSPVPRAPMYTRDGRLVEKTFVPDTDRSWSTTPLDYLRA